MCYYLISMEGNNFRDSKIRGVYKVMKKFWLLIVIGTVLFMPKGVEAKEYRIEDFCNRTDSIEIEPGGVIVYDREKTNNVCPLPILTGIILFESSKDDIVHWGTIDIWPNDKYNYVIPTYK